MLRRQEPRTWAFRPRLGAYKPSDPTCAVRIESISILKSVFLASRARQPVAAASVVGGSDEPALTSSLHRRQWPAWCERGTDVYAVVLHLLWQLPNWHPARRVRCRALWTAVDAPPGLAAVESCWRWNWSGRDHWTWRGTSEEHVWNASRRRFSCSGEASGRPCQGRVGAPKARCCSKPDATTVGRFRSGLKCLADLVHVPPPTGRESDLGSLSEIRCIPCRQNILTAPAQRRSAAG